MGGLGDEAVVLHGDAQVPGGAAVWRIVDEDGVEQSTSADRIDEVGFADEVVHRGPETVAQVAGALSQVLVFDHFEGGHGHSASDRVAAKGGAVLTGMDDAHDRVVGENRAHRVDAP